MGSDHYLVAAKIRLKLRRISKSSLRKKLDLDRLKDEAIKTNFCINLQNRFEILADTLQLEHETGIDVEELWCNIRDVFTKTGEESLGYPRHKRKKWISPGLGN